MRGVKIHGVLLVGTLLWAFQTWTRERPSLEDRERALIWDRDTTELVALTYESDRRRLQVSWRSRDGDRYLWGVEVARPGADGAAGDTLRYPLGVAGSRLVQAYAELRVVRDLGTLAEDRLTELGLDSPAATLTLEFDDGTRELRMGNTVFGGGDRYAYDPEARRAFVLPADAVRPLETGQGALRERALHHFRPDQVSRVRIASGGRERVMQRASQGGEAPPLWFPPEAPDRADAAFGDFMERVSQLGIDGFPLVEPQGLELIVRLDLLDGDGDRLGFVELLRDPSDPAGDLYVRSERTHVVARAIKLLAERVIEEVPAQF